MTDDDPTLLSLAERVEQHLGRIEDMGEDERVFLLGMFAGAVRRLEAGVRELYYQERDGDGSEDALPPLHQVMLALGAPEDWK